MTLGTLACAKLLFKPSVPLRVAILQPREADFFLGAEMRVESSFGDSGRFDDLLDAGGSITLLIEQSRCDIDKFIALAGFGFCLRHGERLARPVGRVNVYFQLF